MTIAEYIRTLDDPKAAIAYPLKALYQSDSGNRVVCLDHTVQQRVRSGDRLVGPLQVIRRPGLGDKVFAIAACYEYLAQHPESDLTFSGYDTDTWLKYLPWLKTGLNMKANTVVNLDNTPCNGGDRTQLMGKILGVEVTSIEFPIKVPKRNLGLPSRYYVFVPFANQNGPRSLPLETTLEVLRRSPLPLVFTDAKSYEFELGHGVVNRSGLGMDELLALVAGSAGVIACDTGVPWLAAAMGKPAMVFFSHVRSWERTNTCQHVLAVDSPADCAKNCGDHVGSRPACRWRDGVPSCTRYYTPELVRHYMREFGGLT